jgi:hypothetical protein
MENNFFSKSEQNENKKLFLESEQNDKNFFFESEQNGDKNKGISGVARPQGGWPAAVL